MAKLGVNVDHIATIRQARGTVEPDPVWGASICELAGCDSIVAHLREDRRHIQDRDIEILRQTVRTKLNLEMSISKEIVGIAQKIKPDQATLVPEKRKELTTEGGLDVSGNQPEIKNTVKDIEKKGIGVSLFIDPDKKQIEASKKIGAGIIELHTGNYAEAKNDKERCVQLNILKEAAELGLKLGLVVNAGHGLTYQNVSEVAKIKGIEELNIGHSIISRAVFVGLDKAVREMKELITVVSR